MDKTAPAASVGPKPLKDTLQLPSTQFSMRANLAEKEPRQLAAWQEQDLWRQIQKARASGPKFVLHDGPPYANGDLHHGHILNKVLKDIIVKLRTMQGHAVHYVPGWDCHGLPIEVQVDKELKGQARNLPPVSVHEACAAWAARFVAKQADGFRRLGVFADWQAPYRTMDFAYEAAITRAFGRLVATGLIYRGLRPVHWCPVHQTALAEAEIEYDDKTSPSIYVGLRLCEEQPDNAVLAGVCGPIDVAIWTTTPWSLPGNVAVAVHPEADYLVVATGDRHVIVAEPLWPAFVAATQGGALGTLTADATVVGKFAGAALAGLRYMHPFLPRQGQVLADGYVALDTGTGAVHNAPAHGPEDFALAQRYDLAFPSPVDPSGKLNDAAGRFAGLSLAEATPAIERFLAESGALLNAPGATLVHRYAHCWRCHKPILTRATQQWFLAMDRAPRGQKDTLRTQALAALKTVRWFPEVGVERIRGMLEGRPDWCLSRQRVWGVPVPVIYCNACETPFVDPEAIQRVADVVARKGARAWYTEGIPALFGAVRCRACGKDDFRQEQDILDVWFDSGSSYAAVLQAVAGAGHAEGPPADLYLEGSDQHRGWFHSSLLISVATEGRAPYRQVLTHGFVVDGAGKKLSKSRGNAGDPFATLQRDGAELFRLWTACEDTQQDVRTSPAIMRQLGEHYRKLRNTLRYLLGNLHGFAPDAADANLCAALQGIDVLALGRHADLLAEVHRAYADYQFHQVLQTLLGYCTSFLSSTYLDVLKDRLYADAAHSAGRRAAQAVLYVIARDLIRLLAPVLSFTAEEAWAHLPRSRKDPHSVHLALLPGAAPRADEPDIVRHLVDHAQTQAALRADMEKLLTLRAVCNQSLEQARRDKVLGASVEARLLLRLEASWYALARRLAPTQLADLLIVSEVIIMQAEGSDGAAAQDIAVEVTRADGQKCARCWLYRTDMQASATGEAVCSRCREAIAP